MASLLLDHNLSPRLATLLARAGHVVTTALAVQLDQASDAEILQLAGRSGLIVVTCDADFADLHADSAVSHAGVVLIPQPSREQAADMVAEIARLLASGHPLPGELCRFSPAAGWMST